MNVSVEKQLQTALDRIEIQNLMSRYIYCHYYNAYDEVAKLFADRDDTTVEIANWGVYKGMAGVIRLYPELHGKLLIGDRKGRLHANCVSTPVIEVAEDGQTAQGMWFMSGAETSPKGEHTEDGLDPHWTWARYCIDFIKDNGVWKIWHFYVAGLFHTPYDTSWVDHTAPHDDLSWIPAEYRSDEPPTFNYEYNTEEPISTFPHLPEPYETFADVVSYYNPDVRA